MKNLLFRGAAIAACALLLACSPRFDWREVRGSAAPYLVLFPAKPDTHAREIDLAGTPVTMTMTGAEVNDVTFAIGSIALADATRAQQALNDMKTALVRNINGKVLAESVTAPAPGTTMIALEARGPLTGGGERLMLARFVARGRHAYQLLVIGEADSVEREAADTFLDSIEFPG